MKPTKLSVPVCRTRETLVETRSVVEEDGVKEKKILSGHFSMFDTPYEIDSRFEGRFVERVAPGAFAKTLKERGDKIRVTLEHGHSDIGDRPLGKPTRIEEDERGAYFEVELFTDASYVRDLLPALEANQYSSSFRFAVVKDVWSETPERSANNPEGIPERTILEARVFEFGPVCYPANESATAGLRSSTDSYYESLRHRDPETYDAAVRSAGLRLPDEDNGVTSTDSNIDVSRKEFSGKDREDLSKEGKAMPDGSFPIENVQDLKNAIQAIGRAKDPEAAKKHIKKRAKALGAEDLIPEDWTSSSTSDTDAEEDKRSTEFSSESQQTPEPVEPSSIGDVAASTEPVEARTAETKTEPREHSAIPQSNLSKKEKTTMSKSYTSEERAARMSEISERMTELANAYADADMPEADAAEFDALVDERAQHEAAQAKIVARREMISQIGRDSSRSKAREAGAPTSAPAVHKSRDIYDVDEMRHLSRSELRDNAMRAVEGKRSFGSVRSSDAQESVEKLLHTVDNAQGDVARRILNTGSETYERAFGKVAMALHTNSLSQEERAALAIGADATGGFAVPFTLDPSLILTTSGSVNPVRQLARKVSISNKSWQGVTTGGITVTRSAEGAEANESEPTLAGPEVTPQRVTGFIKYSHEVDMDWTQMQSEMAMLLADARDQEESTAFTTGTGTPPAASGLISTLNATSHVAGSADLALALGDVYALENAMGPRFRDKAIFMASKTVFNQIRQADVYGGGQMWERIGAGMPSQLLGYNAYENSAMSSATTTEDALVLLFGDMSQYIIVDRVGMTVELVPHLVGANRIPTAQRGLLAVWRNNSKVLVDNAFRLLKITDIPTP